MPRCSIMGSKLSHIASPSLRASPSVPEISSSGHPSMSTSARASSPESERKIPPTETAFSAAVRATATTGSERSSSQPGANRRPKNLTSPYLTYSPWCVVDVFCEAVCRILHECAARRCGQPAFAP
jgi:hypothetical protein